MQALAEEMLGAAAAGLARLFDDVESLHLRRVLPALSGHGRLAAAGDRETTVEALHALARLKDAHRP